MLFTSLPVMIIEQITPYSSISRDMGKFCFLPEDGASITFTTCMAQHADERAVAGLSLEAIAFDEFQSH
jgi:hypothetical protein